MTESKMDHIINDVVEDQELHPESIPLDAASFVVEHAGKDTQGEFMPTVLLVTDLGKNNTGAISAEDLTSEQKASYQADSLKPEYFVAPTDCWSCVDTRVEEDGLVPEEGEADKQVAGNIADTQAAAATMMPGQTQKISQLVEKHTKEAIDNGHKLKAHGDSHKGRAGCGAKVALVTGSTLKANVENIEVVAPTVWALSSEVLGMGELIKEADVRDSIIAGGEYASNPDNFDISVEDASELQESLGAQYVILAKKHNEKENMLIVSNLAYARRKFMLDHPREDGDHNGLFVATVLAYKNDVFEMVKKRGGSDRDAALEVMRGLLFNVGTLKGLESEETGKGETLPVLAVK